MQLMQCVSRRFLPAARRLVWAVMVCLGGHGAFALAESVEAPDALIKHHAGELLEIVNKDSSVVNDPAKVLHLIDDKIMPNVSFTRMTASAVGPAWRRATPEQRKRIIEEFKTLLIRTYSGALKKMAGLTLIVKPLRASPGDTEVVVRTEVRGKGEPLQIDYRMEKVKAGDASVWRIYDMNVLGAWLVETYRGQFATEINTNGVEGLILSLQEKNRGAKK